MIEVHQRLGQKPGQQAQHQVVLSHEQRDRGRLRLHSTTGLEVRVFLDRGKPLEVGELLQANNGELVEVVGATEQVCVAYCDDWQLFSRACYHLGNRHVRLQVGDRWLRIKPDHVLADMLIGLGLEVEMAEAVFVPESGAYAQGGHSHGHGHTHDHGNSHAHSHAYEHLRGHVHTHADDHDHSHDHADCMHSHAAQPVLPLSAPKRKARTQASGHSHG